MTTKSRRAAQRGAAPPGSPRPANRPGAAGAPPAVAPTRTAPPASPPSAESAGATSRAGASLTRREQRLREEALARGGQRRDHRLLWVAGAIVALALIGGSIFGVTRSLQSTPPVALNQTYQAPTGYNQHVPEGTTIPYPTNPPSSGPHYPTPANWGFYTQALPTGTWVHNLEHGGIDVLYRCDTSCAALQQQLQAVYQQIPNDPRFNERKVVITPYPNLDYLLRVQAWGWTMPLDTVDQQAIDAFYHEHVDQGPEQIP